MMMNQKTIKYGIEIAGIRITGLGPAYTDQLKSTMSISDLGSAVFAASVYDMTFDKQRACDLSIPYSYSRRLVRRVGGLAMQYMNLLDDAIDDRELGLNNKQKRDFITKAVNATWVNNQSLGQGSLPETPYFENSSRLGSHIRDIINTQINPDPFIKTMRQFAKAEGDHGEDKSPEGLMCSVVELGKPCGLIMSSTVQTITGVNDEAVAKAAESLGVYGMLLDHAFEVNADLRDDSPTVVTAIIERDGDSRKSRRAGRAACLDMANDWLKEGSIELTRRQRKIYCGVASLFDLRYKMITRINDSI